MNALIVIAGAITAITIIGGALLKIYKTISKVEKKLETVNELQESQKRITKAVFASLDGLRQLGANGPVTKAYDELQNYLIEKE